MGNMKDTRRSEGRQRRGRLLRIRAHDADLQRWRAAAKRDGVNNLSHWMRAAADQTAACGEDPLAWRRDLAGLLRDLNAGLGNNLNQIARSLGAPSTEAPCGAALARMADELAGLRREVRAHLLGARPSLRRNTARSGTPRGGGP